MTDNEIVIALRAVAEKYKGKFVATCEINISEMATDAADHIERLCEENNFLKAEIERLNKEVDRLSQVVLYHDGHIADAKSEARKELAERLKKELFLIKKECRKFLDNDGAFAIDKAIKKVDNLVKEMENKNNA